MLQGDKVLLRPVEREDLETLAPFLNDVEVSALAGGSTAPESVARLEALFDKEVEKGVNEERLEFVIEADGRVIGWCGLFDFSESANYRLAILIGDRAYWGRGYGREAVSLLTQWAFEHRNAHKVWLEVNANNERAIRAYTACGFVTEGTLRESVWIEGAYRDELMMGILRSEWKPPYAR